MLSGIPQGSVLGPLLFVLFINDLPEAISESDMFLFADDLKLFKGIFKMEDCHKLQQDLEQVHEWTDKSLLRFHPDKCVKMRIGKSEIYKQDYTLGSSPPIKLRDSDKEKDIGVVIDSNLSFESHMHEKINAANSVMGIIRRTFDFLDESTFLTLYKSLVRPHLEYANQVWAPNLQKHVTALENVQRRATKLVPGLRDLSYEERLRKVKLPSLAYRRLRGDMIELFKIISGKYDTTVCADMFQFVEGFTRGHKYKIFKVRSHNSLRQNSFTLRTINTWNALPSSVIDSQTVMQFEKKLDYCWADHPLLYDYMARTSVLNPRSWHQRREPIQPEEDL